MDPSARLAKIWIGGFVALAGALVFLYPDSHQQDGGNHFLFARWAWVHPELFVGVWSRPGFTFLYSFPALLGYPAAKLFTALVAGACAWHTWKAAIDLGLARPWLSIPLLFFQPVFLLLSSETMTEPLFALILVVGIRLHLAGRVKAGMIAASALILTRPEGFVLAAVWAGWVLIDPRDPRPRRRRVLSLSWLGTGAAAWWLSALAITGEPLFILRTWPHGWSTLTVIYGTGPLWDYALRLPEVIGPLLLIPFILGVADSRVRIAAVMALTVFVMHSVLWWMGAFGTAGLPRYMVTVSPAIAILSLAGWNAIADRLAHRRLLSGTAVLVVSAVFSLLYVDGWTASRDAPAVEEARLEFLKNPRPVRRLVWSQAYMAILFEVDPWSSPAWGDRARNLEIIAGLPPQTLVFWDDLIGPAHFQLTDADFERAGFVRLHSKAFVLTRRFGKKEGWIGIDGPRRQAMHLLYRP